MTALKECWVACLIFFFNLNTIYFKKKKKTQSLKMIIKYPWWQNTVLLMSIKNINIRIISTYCIGLKKFREKEDASEDLMKANNEFD